MSSKKFRFDGWVLDPESGDLERSGTRVRLQEQPALVLRELITHAGSVVTREQLIALLWPKGVVDFDTGVNTAIRKLRSALGDTAETPRYIETLPRRGYRFIGSVDPDPETMSAVRSADLPISAPGEATSGAVHSAPGPGTPSVPPLVPPPHLPPPREKLAGWDESPSSVASGAAPRRRSLPSLALLAALAVAVLAIGAYAAWRAHFAASMTAVRVEAPPASALPAHTVAVLPFENLSAEPSDAFLATGIAESVLHRLASVKSLSVIARTSSFTFRGRDVDARDIGRGEVDQGVALFLEALRVNPTFHPALSRLGEIEWFRGNFAGAAKFMEHAIALDPKAEWIRNTVAMVYLDLGDVAAAQDVLSTASATSLVRNCISSYRGEGRRAAADLHALPQSKLTAMLLNKHDNDCPSAVIRDDALARHDYGRGLRALEVCLAPEWDSVFGPNGSAARTSCALRYASLLIASGKRDRATKLLHAMLQGMEHHPDNVPERRSVALALLGDTDGALKSLEVAFDTEGPPEWWYDFERSPDFEGLHAQPRFESLVKRYRDIVAKQSALLADMRRAGEVPYRPAPQSTSAQ